MLAIAMLAHHSSVSAADALTWITWAAAVLYVVEKVGVLRRLFPGWSRWLRAHRPTSTRFIRLPESSTTSWILGLGLLALSALIYFVSAHWKATLVIASVIIGAAALTIQWRRDVRRDKRRVLDHYATQRELEDRQALAKIAPQHVASASVIGEAVDAALSPLAPEIRERLRMSVESVEVAEPEDAEDDEPDAIDADIQTDDGTAEDGDTSDSEAYAFPRAQYIVREGQIELRLTRVYPFGGNITCHVVCPDGRQVRGTPIIHPSSNMFDALMRQRVAVALYPEDFENAPPLQKGKRYGVRWEERHPFLFATFEPNATYGSFVY